MFVSSFINTAAENNILNIIRYLVGKEFILLES